MNTNFNGLNNQQMNIPNLVNNIENNMDTFGNSNMNNYVPINNDKLTYNPNIQRETFNQGEQMHMQQPMNNMQNHMNMQQPMSNMQQSMNNMPPPMMNRMPPNMMNPNFNNKNNVVNTIETIDNTEPGFFSNKGKRVKQLLTYTILFIIFSHSKMTELLCNKIPFLANVESNIPCITFKGFLVSIIIMILNHLLNF